MGDIEITPAEISKRVRDRLKKYKDFPVMVRADFAVPHKAVAQVMNACTEAGVWKISFVAIGEDKTSKPGAPGRPRLDRAKRRGGGR
jgi:biopolymer transport protein ExbD